MSNPYTADAAQLLRQAETADSPGFALDAAQVKATLALAYEQRTANLLTAATAKYADGTAMFPDLMGADEGIQYDIRERLE